jgi:hypothetical protein
VITVDGLVLVSRDADGKIAAAFIASVVVGGGIGAGAGAIAIADRRKRSRRT